MSDNNNPKLSNRTFRQNLPTDATNSERMIAEYNAFKPLVEANFNTILDEYGLAEQLVKAKASATKLKILSFQCCEGLYLHLFSEILEKRGLLAEAELYGIDSDPTMIISADELSRVSSPPRPYLHFYRHDLTQPLEAAYDLSLLRDSVGQVQFNFIFSHYGITYTPTAKAVLEGLYTNNLADGGLLYLRDVVAHQGDNGWQTPHPAFQLIMDITTKVVTGINPDIMVAEAKTAWLAELGAADIRSALDLIPMGGASVRGQGALQNLVIAALMHGHIFQEMGMWNNEERHEYFNFVYNKLTLNDVGQWAFIDTLARKPELA